MAAGRASSAAEKADQEEAVEPEGDRREHMELLVGVSVGVGMTRGVVMSCKLRVCSACGNLVLSKYDNLMPGYVNDTAPHEGSLVHCSQPSKAHSPRARSKPLSSSIPSTTVPEEVHVDLSMPPT